MAIDRYIGYLGTAALTFTLLLYPGGRVEAQSDVATLLHNDDLEGLRAVGPSVTSELVAKYRASDEDGRAHLAWVMYNLGYESGEAKNALMEDVHSSHDDLRVWSQYALGRVSKDEDVVDVLFDNMKSGEKWLFRDKAACSLAYDQIHLSERQRLRLLARLINELDDEEGAQRGLAIRVLEVQTGQRRGYNPHARRPDRLRQIEEWWRWWNTYKAEVAAIESPSR